MPRRSKIRLLDSHLLLPYEFQPTHVRASQLQYSESELGRFLRNAMLYDSLIIPTVDLAIVPLLVQWLGIDNLISALESQDIKIARYTGVIGYAGNGRGLVSFELRTNIEGRVQQLKDLNWAPSELAIETRGQELLERGVSADRWKVLRRVILDRLAEIDPSTLEQVFQGTYRDLRENVAFRYLFQQDWPDLTSVGRLGPDQLRPLDSTLNNDDIDTLLHITQFNFESYLAERFEADDQVSGPAAKHILHARIQQTTQSAAVADAFVRVLDLNRMPDFGAAGTDSGLRDRIWKARGSRDAREFRQWFHDRVRSDPMDAERRFIDDLARPAAGDRFVVRGVRYLVFDVALSLVPGLSAVANAALNAADAFLLDRFVRARSPKVMLDGVRAQLHQRQA